MYEGFEIYTNIRNTININDPVIQEQWHTFVTEQLLDARKDINNDNIKELWQTTYYDTSDNIFKSLDDTASVAEIMDLLIFAHNNPHLYDTKSVRLLKALMDGQGKNNFFRFLADGKLSLSDLKDLLCISDCSPF